MTELFGDPIELALSFTSNELVPMMTRAAGKLSVSGYQPKLSLRVVDGRLESVEGGGTHILKPADRWPHLPANEHATMQLAKRLGFEVPPCTTVPLADDVNAFLIRRFDRVVDAHGKQRKLRMEDFCQVLGRRTSEKDKGSTEHIVKGVRDHFADVEAGLLELFRRMVLIWWTGCGDMHLKNFSVMFEGDKARWAPIYDLHSTYFLKDVHSAHRNLILSLDGTTQPRHGHWMRFAKRCGLDDAQVAYAIESIVGEIGRVQILIFCTGMHLTHIEYSH